VNELCPVTSTPRIGYSASELKPGLITKRVGAVCARQPHGRGHQIERSAQVGSGGHALPYLSDFTARPKLNGTPGIKHNVQRRRRSGLRFAQPPAVLIRIARTVRVALSGEELQTLNSGEFYEVMPAVGLVLTGGT
jgi:hypothetical protein